MMGTIVRFLEVDLMRRCLALLAVAVLVVSCSGSKNGLESQHAIVQLNDGTQISGVVKSSSGTEMVVAGDDGIERKIPMAQVKAVTYKPVTQPAAQPATAAPPPVAVKTYELPAGTEVPVRTGDLIDSATAAEGQTFAVSTTADTRDAGGDIVIPNGSAGSVVIKSASKGGRFKGQSDLVLTLQSVNIGGAPYAVDTTDFSRVGKQGMGKNKRTAKFAGGGAAVGAIVGAIAGGGKGAAIGAGVGAGGGLVAQAATKGGSIKVPAGAVLTFRLQQPLRVTVQQ
jgi:hypothetical protein